MKLANGQFVNHKRVLRIMRENNLLCEIKKSFINTTDSNHNLRKYSNIPKKESVEITRPDQVWASDITYIRLLEGFVYLAVIIDVFTRKVIGCCLGKNIDSDLVITALKMAIKERKITNANHQLIHHSDQTVQYCSHDYTNLLEFHGIKISMNTPRSPWQNGFAESFFKTLKTNEVYSKEDSGTRYTPGLMSGDVLRSTKHKSLGKGVVSGSTSSTHGWS
jgi:putative transposase